MACENGKCIVFPISETYTTTGNYIFFSTSLGSISGTLTVMNNANKTITITIDANPSISIITNTTQAINLTNSNNISINIPGGTPLVGSVSLYFIALATLICP